MASFSVIFIALGLLGQQALHGALTGPAALKVSGGIIIAMGLLFVPRPSSRGSRGNGTSMR